MSSPGRDFTVTAVSDAGYASVTVTGSYQIALLPGVGPLTITRTRQMALTGASP